MKQIMRPAIAMIELIFAIVIMGIVLMSAPQLISSATKSGYVTLQQEAINEAASQVNMVLGYYWDEAVTDETLPPSVLHVNAGNADLDENGTSGLRKGTPRLSRRSFIRFDGQEFAATATTSAAWGNADKDDIDDFIGISNMTEIESASADYTEKDTINISTVVDYMADSPTTGGGTYTPNGSNAINFNFTSASPGDTTNIKRITVTLTSTSGVDELNKTIVLNAFSCNIGATEFEEMTF